jgi:hypothetical protein
VEDTPVVDHNRTSGAATRPATAFDSYSVLGPLDALPAGSAGRVTLWDVEPGHAVFAVRDAAGHNRMDKVPEGGPVPLTGLAGWSVEVLGVRPRTDSRGAWAVCRLIPPAK